MEITLVNEENRMYFDGLAPSGIWKRADLVLGAIERGQACGLLMATWLEEDAVICYLYVEEEFRRKKIATRLMDTLHLLARVGSRASVRCSYVGNDDTVELDAFFSYHRFVQEEETNPMYRIPLGALDKTFLCKPIRQNVYDKLIPIRAVSAREWMQLVKRMKELRKYDEHGVFPELGSREQFHGAYSFLHIVGDQCVGCILIHEQDGCYVIDFLWNAMERPKAEVVVLLQAAYQVMSAKCEEDTVICVNALTRTSRKIVEYFAKDQELDGMVITQSYIY